MTLQANEYSLSKDIRIGVRDALTGEISGALSFTPEMTINSLAEQFSSFTGAEDVSYMFRAIRAAIAVKHYVKRNGLTEEWKALMGEEFLL